MKREKLYNAITDIRDDLVERAQPRKSRRRRWWPAAVAAVLAVAILGGVILSPGGNPALRAYALETADYPKMAAYPGNNGNYEAWREDIQAQRGPKGYADGLDSFFTQTISQFLSGSGSGNKVYSPLNVYMALAMLAEVTGGDSRAQILELLGRDSIESLREQAGYLWNANYRDDGATTSVLASSLWLNEGIEFDRSALKTLAEHYYASSYQGEMGSEKLNEALHTWLNEQTGGLLEEQIGNQELSAETVLALAATVYFRAKWDREFNADYNTEDVFHAPDGDVTVEYMHRTKMDKNYYWGEHFAAVSEQLENAGQMWFILPDEDVTVDHLLKDPETMDFLLNYNQWENSKFLMVNESIPKFDVASNLDLVEELKTLGITEVFDPLQADFSPVTDFEPVWAGEVVHAARVVIDEEGCEAAAYTVIESPGAPPPPDEEVDFVLDRPFLFVLTGLDGLPLFVGVVNQP